MSNIIENTLATIHTSLNTLDREELSIKVRLKGIEQQREALQKAMTALNSQAVGTTPKKTVRRRVTARKVTASETASDTAVSKRGRPPKTTDIHGAVEITGYSGAHLRKLVKNDLIPHLSEKRPDSKRMKYIFGVTALRNWIRTREKNTRYEGSPADALR